MPVRMKLLLDIRVLDIPDFNKLSELLLTTSINAFLQEHFIEVSSPRLLRFVHALL